MSVDRGSERLCSAFYVLKDVYTVASLGRRKVLPSGEGQLPVKKGLASPGFFPKHNPRRVSLFTLLCGDGVSVSGERCEC